MRNNFDEISLEECKKTNNLLMKMGPNRLIMHTLVLTGPKQPLGTVLLIKYKDKLYLVTPAHVVECMEKEPRVGLAIKPDNIYREIQLHPSDLFQFKRWDPQFKKDDLKENPLVCKDLAIAEVPVIFMQIIRATKEPLQIEEEEEELNFSSSYLTLGVLRHENRIQMRCSGVVLHEKKEENKLDFYIARAMKETRFAQLLGFSNITNYEGNSGAGLFLHDSDSDRIRLLGIAFCQNREHTLDENGFIELYYYGPRSIVQFLNDCTS